MNYAQSNNLRKVVVQVPRQHSSMFYFLLESNDNLAFYSTLSFDKDSLFRRICVHCTPELYDQLENMMNHFSQKYELEVISNELVKDKT